MKRKQKAAAAFNGVGILLALLLVASIVHSTYRDLNPPPPPPEPGPVALDQAAYRFRNDDGNETTATWIAPANTQVEVDDVDSFLRVRILVQSDSENEVSGFQLQYNKNSGGWNNVTESSSVIRSVGSANFTDQDNTTQQLGAGVFQTGKMDAADGSANGGNAEVNINFNEADEETECEFMLKVLENNVVPGDLIELRIDGLDTYSETPIISVGLYLPEVPPVYLPHRQNDPRHRRYTSGRGGHFSDLNITTTPEEPEAITIAEWEPLYPDGILPKRQAPRTGWYALVEVPAVADVIEHGWEIQNWENRISSRQRKRERFIRSLPSLTAFQFTPTAAIAAAVLGEFICEPTYAGKVRGQPKYAGEIRWNREGPP